MAVKYVYEVKTSFGSPDKVWDTFNVAAKDFEQAVQKAEEEITAYGYVENEHEETIIAVTRTVKLGRGE